MLPSIKERHIIFPIVPFLSHFRHAWLGYLSWDVKFGFFQVCETCAYNKTQYEQPNWSNLSCNIVAEQVVCRCCSFYHPSFKLVAQQKFETGVVKRATLTHNSFSNNVAERVVRFLLLVFPRLYAKTSRVRATFGKVLCTNEQNFTKIILRAHGRFLRIRQVARMNFIYYMYP